MDPEIKKLLEENLAVAKNNNEILRSIRHHQWLSALMSILFWVAVAVAPFYLYQQYLAPIMGKFSSFGTSTAAGMFSVPTSADIQKLLNSVQSGKK